MEMFKQRFESYLGMIELYDSEAGYSKHSKDSLESNLLNAEHLQKIHIFKGFDFGEFFAYFSHLQKIQKFKGSDSIFQILLT